MLSLKNTTFQQKGNLIRLTRETTGGPDVVCNLCFQTFKTMYENASKIPLNTAYGKEINK